MMNIWAYLSISVIGSIAKRVLSALGIGVVAYVGFDQLLQFVRSQLEVQIGQLPTAVLQLAGLANVDIAVNIIFSAYSVSVSLMVAKRLTKS